MITFTAGEIIGVLTLASGCVTNWWSYRIRKQALANEMAIAELHQCVDANNRIAVEAAKLQAQMHVENRPVLRETLEGVRELVKSDGK